MTSSSTSPSSATDLAPGRFLSTSEVMRETTFSRTTLWRRIREGDFPPPTPLGKQKRGWTEREVEQWKADVKAAASR